MYFRSVMSREWKSTVKIVIGLFSLLAIVLALSMSAEARDYQIRASDGELYTVTLGENSGVKNFSVQKANGEILRGATETERDIAAELYFAAELLSRVLPHYSSDTLIKEWEDWEEEVAGVVKRGILKLLTKQGLDILTNGVVNGLTGTVQLILGGNKASIVAGWIPEAINNAIGDEIEHRLLVDASAIAEVYARGAVENAQVLRAFWLSYENPSIIISMDGINAAWVAFHQLSVLSSVVPDLLDRYVKDPDSEVSVGTGGLGNIAVSLLPAGETLTTVAQGVATIAQATGTIIQTLETIDSAIYTNEHIQHLQYISENGASDIYQHALSRIVEGKNRSRAALEQASFFQPTKVVQLDDIWILEDDSPQRLDVRDYFSPSDTDNLTYIGRSNDSSVAVAQVERSGSSVIIITPKDAGTTSVIVELITLRGLSVTQSFTVTVEERAQENQPPEAEGTIPTQNLTVEGPSRTVDVAPYFSSQSDLTYTAKSSDTAVATAKHVGSRITIWPRGIGTARITVTAANSDGLSATQTFNVAVSATEPPPERPTPQGLRVGDSIIVQNTGGIGLNVRSNPWVSNQNPDNRIGRVYDGATGTIKNGTEPDANGHTWWEVAWDTSNKVEWWHQPANNRGWSVEAIGELELLARRPPEPVPQSFDLAIESFTVSKRTLDPGESFTLSITIRNDGPGDSPGPALSYYHSSIQGFSRTDPPQLQGTVELDPLASGERITKSIQLTAPATADTYYYGAWLAANTGDTDIYNDVATEIGVTVIDDTIDDPIETSDPPDLVIENISVDYDTMYPGEGFTVSATVRNAGGRRASNVRLRYYRSSDRTYSTDDEEIANTDDFIGGLDGGETEDENAHLDAPDEQGVYYYIARAEPVRNEVDTDNNYAAIQITVLPPATPDLVVSLTVEPSRRIVSLSANEYLIDSKKYFRLDATVDNQGKEESEKTEIHFYRSLDPYPSPEDDTRIETEEIKALRRADSRFYSSDEEASNGPAPTEPGTYYYYACVDSVLNERNTDNNCSNVITINVRGPDLVVHSVSVDYFSRTHTTVRPDGIFELEVTVRNQGTEDADDATLRYYISSDAILSPDDTEVATDRVYSLDMNETSKTYKSDWIDVPYTSGFFYALVCVDSVEDESDTTNNCYAPIKLTVRNVAPRAEGTIPIQTLSAGTSALLDVSAYFTDTNNDDLTYTASSSDLNIVTVRVSGAQVIFTPHQSGSRTITVTASDGALTATQTVSVVVEIETKVPDLLVDSVSVNKNTVAPGDGFRLDAVIRNQGEADASAITVRYYQSTDDTISTTDTERNTGTVVLIAVDGVKEPWAQLTAPDTPGVYYYGICVDGVEGESDTDNNCSEPVKITVQPPSLPDLVVESISVSDDTLASGESFTLSVTVRNKGTQRSQATRLHYYADNAEVHTNFIGRLVSDEASEKSIILKAPDEIGTYYYEACVSKVHGESNTDNNCSTRIAITVGTPVNQVPVLVGTVAPRTLSVGGTSEQVDVKGYFQDPDADTLTYKASSDNAGVVSVSVSGSHVTLTPEGEGDANVAVTASDGKLSVTQTISVSVTAGPVTPPVADKPVANRSPVSVGTISHRTLTIGKGSEQVDVKGYFQDPDADTLTYKASSDNINVVSVDVSGSDVTLMPKSVGRASVTVTASDGKLIATQTISVSVLNSLNKIAGPWLWIIAPTEVGRGGANSIDVDSLNAASGGTVTEASVAANGAKAGGTVGNYVWTLGKIAETGRNNINDVINKISLVDGRNPATTADDMNVDDHSSYALITLQSTTARSNVTMRAGSDDAIKVWLNGQVVHRNPMNRGAADFQDSFKVNLRKEDNLLLVKVSERSGRWSMFVGIDADVNIGKQSTTGEQSTDLTAGLILYHSYNEGKGAIAADSSGNGHNGRISSPEWVAGRFGKALRFGGEGSSTFVTVGSTPLINVNECTFMAWINAEHWKRRRQIVGKSVHGGCSDRTQYGLFSENGTLKLRFETESGRVDIATDLPPTGQWVHVVFTNDGKTAKIYIDGRKVATGAIPGRLKASSDPWQIGQDCGRPDYVFAGMIDEVRLWNRALTAAEISNLKGELPAVDEHRRFAAPSFSASRVLPKETLLLPNYPNPFNPETWIPYQLSASADVSVSIYAVDRRLVRRLDLGHQVAGVYRSRSRAAYWDGRNAFGERVASGLYFYTLTAGDFTATGKMLVRK